MWIVIAQASPLPTDIAAGITAYGYAYLLAGSWLIILSLAGLLVREMKGRRTDLELRLKQAQKQAEEMRDALKRQSEVNNRLVRVLDASGHSRAGIIAVEDP